MTASQVFGVPIEGMDPMVRRQAKAINFGIIYGLSSFGLARQLDISNRAASDYINAYFERYPGIHEYMEKTKEEARNQGYVSTLFGRKCHVRGIGDKNPGIRSFAERAAINARIQGSAAEIMRLAMFRLNKKIKNIKIKMLLQIHDELIFEVPNNDVKNLCEVIKEEMISVKDSDLHSFSTPLTVDINTGDNWGILH